MDREITDELIQARKQQYAEWRKEHGDTDLTRRIEPGTVTKLLPNNWVEVTLESGIKVAMSENDMKIACGQTGIVVSLIEFRD